MHAKTSCVGFAVSAMLTLVIASTANAQAYFYRWDNGGGNNNWGTGTNWGLNPPLNLGVNNVTPSAWFEEMGLINNGNVVNVTTSQTQFSSSAANNAVGAAGVTIDGLTASPGNGSRLNIASGGHLRLYVTYGPNGAPVSTTPTANTGDVNLVNFGQLTVQPGGTLTVGDDILITSGTFTAGGAAAGGTVTANRLVQSPTNGTLTLQGSASMTLSDGAVLNGTTNIIGPNVVLNTAGLSMASTTIFSPDIMSPAVAAGTGHSVIKSTGSISVNGTIRPHFHNGVVPALGSTWTIFDAAQIQGDFSASDATGVGATLPTGLRYALTTTTVGAINGIKGQLTVENFLTAEVNRGDGSVRIRNTNTTVGPGVTINGFAIGSAAGALDPEVFSSPFGAPWESAGLSDNTVAQLNTGAGTVVGLNGNHPLGNIYDPVELQTTFGTAPVEDLTFTYTRSDGRTVNAPVTYVGTGLANTFVLQVDPTDGKARIINDSVFDDVEFDGYHITSVENRLRATWNSLDDQSAAGWEETFADPSTIGELNPLSTMNVDAGQVAAEMTGLFLTGGAQDLQFSFRAAAPATGAAIGDYNNDGTVNAADYTVWRDNLGLAISLPNDDDTQSPNQVTMADYTVWKNNFGNTGSSVPGQPQIYTGVVRYQAFALGGGAIASPVPEPSTFLLVGFAGLAISLIRRW